MRLLQRKFNSHKGDYGHILILAGSARFSGAALLCAEAALRAGAGLVTLGIPKSINLALIRTKPKELITFPLPETKEGTLSLTGFSKISSLLKKIDVLIIGPGLDSNKSTYALVKKIIRRTIQAKVVDADALNALSKCREILKSHKGQLILTPHQMEMSRLFDISIDAIKNKRKLVAKRLAKYYNSIIVLKGHHSIVTDGLKRYYMNRSGNPGMATAGSGDVLSGIIGAFLAQGLDGFEAAKYGTYIHGLAGDLAAKEKTQMGLIASDIIHRIPDALKKSS
ncbi:MAG: NAD(P)H-hydrate dehydratase [Candidatus Omnitrophica bacterium]|nr:NAD(P)H-hydrate dehydratase [Candidatus Omnitrophota bacterium]